MKPDNQKCLRPNIPTESWAFFSKNLYSNLTAKDLPQARRTAAPEK